MITLFTGLPGNGKTLFALWYIKAKAEKEGRQVYYHNIKDLVLPWNETDPLKWMDLPKNSIIVIDEAQEIFPKLANGKTRPDHYEKLATHRHYGIDIFLITQHPSLIDNFPRKLTGQHFHSIRKFGLERATIYEWSAANDSPEKPSSHKNAVSLKFKFPKDAYTWYKSAEVHTVKKSIPLKLILACLFVVAIPVLGYIQLDRFQNRGKHVNDDKRGELASAPGGVGRSGGVGAGGGGVYSPAAGGRVPFDSVADAKAYVQLATPRIVGLPQTAPKYDELTKPTRVPVPAMCMQRGSVSVRSSSPVTCKCYTQQGTPMDVAFNMCVEFARNGFFQEFNPEKDEQQQQRTQNGVQVLSSRPDAPVPVDERSSRVAVLADVQEPKKQPSAPLQWGH